MCWGLIVKSGASSSSASEWEEAAELWRDYNQRACVEQRIEELKNDPSADGFCLPSFYATEAAFLSVLFAFNLLSLYQQATGTRQSHQYQRSAAQCSISPRVGVDQKHTTPSSTKS
jgi:hypothetical protein